MALQSLGNQGARQKRQQDRCAKQWFDFTDSRYLPWQTGITIKIFASDRQAASDADQVICDAF
jgi:hypothetical protein